MFILTSLGNSLYRITSVAAKTAVSGGVIALVVIGFLFWGLISNLFRLDVIAHYGPGLFLHNIIWLHQDEVITTKSGSVSVFDDETTIEEAQRGLGAIATFDPGEFVRVRGHYVSDGHTWVAIEAYNKLKPVYGWIFFSCGDGPKLRNIGSNSCWDTETNPGFRRGNLVADVIEKNMESAGIEAVEINDKLQTESFIEQNKTAKIPYVEVDHWRPWNFAGDERRFFIQKSQQGQFQKIVHGAEAQGDEVAFQLG